MEHRGGVGRPGHPERVVELTAAERALRLYIYQRTVEDGHPPSVGELGRRFGTAAQEVAIQLLRLEQARALLVSADGRQIEAVPPFSAIPTPHWVETDRGGWWGHTAWQALAVSVVVNSNTRVYSRSGGTRKPIEIDISNGRPRAEPAPVVHISVPAARWWDDIRYTCATILFFEGGEEVEEWCRRGGFLRGALMSLDQCWQLARRWYAGRLDEGWRRLSPEEAQASLRDAGLTGPFWDLSAPRGVLLDTSPATGGPADP